MSNDGLLLVATSVLLHGLALVVTGDLTRRTAAWVAAALAVALWTKGLALVLPVPIAVAYLYAARRARAQPADPSPTTAPASLARTLAAPVGLLVVGALVGSVWWVRNLVVHGAVQTDGLGKAGQLALYGTPDDSGRLGDFLNGFLYLTAVRLWERGGSADIPLPGPVVVAGWGALLGAGLLLALLVPDPTGSTGR